MQHVLYSILLSMMGPHAQRGDADAVYDDATSFEFIFILHLMREIMGITDILCQALLRQAQDIVNAMDLVSTTKSLIQDFKDNSWNKLLDEVMQFCSKRKIEVPNMDARY